MRFRRTSQLVGTSHGRRTILRAHRPGRGHRPAGRADPDQHLQPDPSRAPGRGVGGRRSWTRSASSRRSSRPRPGGASTIARIEGSDPSRAPLLVHGHLDVVPADAAEWSVDPFGGEVKDGYVWGRGAIDMKDMDAMVLALVRQWAREGRKPERDIVLAFVSDEEAGGRQGAHYLVDNHAELFADCTEAISEVGGYSISLERAGPRLRRPDRREGHQLAAAEGPQHARPRLDGARRQRRHPARRGGLADRQPRLAGRDHRHRPGARQGPRRGARTRPRPRPARRSGCRCSAAPRGWSARRSATRPTRRCCAAGYKANVIPSRAEATIDCRFLPGQEEALLETIDELIGEHVEREFEVRDIAVETSLRRRARRRR